MTNEEKLRQINSILNRMEALENYFTEAEQKFMVSEFDASLKYITLAAINSDEYHRDYANLCIEYRKLKQQIENDKYTY